MKESKSRIIGIYLPRFLIQRRLREDASLAHRPVGVFRSQENSDRLIAVSRSALISGVTVGSTATQAKAVCPGLRLLKDDPVSDLRALKELAESLLEISPAVELSGAEGIFADASSSNLWGKSKIGEEGLLKALSERCHQWGYRAQMVIADNKFTAMALAMHCPRPQRIERIEGAAASLLAPLSLAVLPASEELLWSWTALGLKTLGDLAALPTSGVGVRFGKEGMLMQRLARGEDPRPLIPLHSSPLLTESMFLEWPAESLEPVLAALKTVVDRLITRLLARGLALTKLEIAFELEGNKEAKIVLPLAKPTRSSSLLMHLFQEQLNQMQVTAPIVAIKVEALETGPGEQVQLSLESTPQIEKALETVLSRLQAVQGEEALFSASPVDVHRPERAWEKIPFRPDKTLSSKESKAKSRHKKLARPELLPREEQGCLFAKKENKEENVLCTKGIRPTRLLSSPKPLKVETSSSGRITAVRIGSRRHVAASVRGPERLQGEWWQTDGGFFRDYFRTLVVGVGGCWIFRDICSGNYYLHGYFD